MKFVEVEDNIYRIKSILDTKDFFLLNDELDSKYNIWRFTKNDSDGLQSNRGCLLKPLSKFNTIGDNLTLIKYGTLLKYKYMQLTFLDIYIEHWEQTPCVPSVRGIRLRR